MATTYAAKEQTPETPFLALVHLLKEPPSFYRRTSAVAASIDELLAKVKTEKEYDDITTEIFLYSGDFTREKPMKTFLGKKLAGTTEFVWENK